MDITAFTPKGVHEKTDVFFGRSYGADGNRSEALKAAVNMFVNGGCLLIIRAEDGNVLEILNTEDNGNNVDVAMTADDKIIGTIASKEGVAWRGICLTNVVVAKANILSIIKAVILDIHMLKDDNDSAAASNGM